MHSAIQVWNLNYIFEKEHHIDKHDLTIDSLSISTKAGIAVVVTRSCIGTAKGFYVPKFNANVSGSSIYSDPDLVF